MPDYDNSNSGVLFRNDRKDTDKHPDYKGNAEVGGLDYWVSAWIKTSRDGTKKFLSLAFDVKEGQPVAATPADVDVPIDNDDIPF